MPLDVAPQVADGVDCCAGDQGSHEYGAAGCGEEEERQAQCDIEHRDPHGSGSAPEKLKHHRTYPLGIKIRLEEKIMWKAEEMGPPDSHQVILLQKLGEGGAAQPVQPGPQGHFEGQRELHLGELPAVRQVVGGVEQAADVVDGAVDLGHAPLHIQQRVDGFLGGADGVLGGEMVSRSVWANWPRKAKLTHSLGTTSGRSPAQRGMKKAVT